MRIPMNTLRLAGFVAASIYTLISHMEHASAAEATPQSVSQTTQSISADLPPIAAKDIVANEEGLSRMKRCGNSWKAHKADLSKVGYSWPKFNHSCHEALNASEGKTIRKSRTAKSGSTSSAE